MVLDYTRDEDGSTNIEQEMHEKTGYDYTYFVGDTRERSSIEGAVGTKASDAVIETVLKGKQDYAGSRIGTGDHEQPA